MRHPDGAMVDLSIIVPTKNEEHAPSLIRELRRHFGSKAEIIIVDKSESAMRKELEATGERVMVQESVGYGNALMDGFRAASGKMLATIDADGTYTVKDLARVIAELEHGGIDFVSGDRSKSAATMPVHIRLGNRFLTSLFNLLYHKKMHDVLSGVFAMKAGAFDSIRNSELYRYGAGTIFFEIELSRSGRTMKDIPVSYGERQGSKPKIKIKPIHGFMIAYNAVRNARDYNPLLIFGAIGLVLFLIGLVQGAFVLAGYAQSGTLSDPGRALLSLLLLIGGVLFIIAALILDLLLAIERKLYRERK